MGKGKPLEDLLLILRQGSVTDRQLFFRKIDPAHTVLISRHFPFSFSNLNIIFYEEAVGGPKAHL